MTDDELRKIVDEAAGESGYGGLDSSTMYGEFALEVAKKVRERCAKLCESMGPVLCESYGDGAECIATADACAEAIRRA